MPPLNYFLFYLLKHGRFMLLWDNDLEIKTEGEVRKWWIVKELKISLRMKLKSWSIDLKVVIEV